MDPPGLWADTAPAGPECPPLDGDAECEVAVIGAGFTGLSAALHLAERGADVRVLEAGAPGGGASGRNGGQVNPGLRALPAAVRARLGDAAGIRVAALAGGAPDTVFDLVARHRIDCAATRNGWIQAAYGRAGLAKANAWVAQWRALGAPVRLLGRDEMQALTGSDAYAGGLLDARGGALQPLAYARGLARAALAAGARVHAASPVRRLERRGGHWRLTLGAGAAPARHSDPAAGTVTARALILAGNGYTDGLWPGLARNVIPVKSVVAATAPLGDNLRCHLLPGGQHVSELRRVGAYYRLDASGRFLLGGRGDTFGPRDAAHDGHLRATALRLFPVLQEVAWTHCWAGLVALTPEGMPRLLDLGDGAWSGLGYNGRGVAMATRMGEQLACAVRGEATALPRMAPAAVLGHRLRNVAVAARVAAGRLLDALEVRGRA